MLDRHTHQPLGPRDGYRLDADAGVFADVLLGPGECVVVEEVNAGVDVRGALFPLNARVDVFGILAEDHHVELLRMFYRRRHVVVVTHGPYTSVEIEHLTQRDVQRAYAASNRRSQRTFDGYMQIANCVYRGIGQPVAELYKGFFSGKHFKPMQLSLAAVSPLNRRIENANGCGPDIAAGAVAFDVGDNRIVGNLQFAVAKGNGAASGRKCDAVV